MLPFITDIDLTACHSLMLQTYIVLYFVVIVLIERRLPWSSVDSTCGYKPIKCLRPPAGTFWSSPLLLKQVAGLCVHTWIKTLLLSWSLSLWLRAEKREVFGSIPGCGHGVGRCAGSRGEARAPSELRRGCCSHLCCRRCWNEEVCCLWRLLDSPAGCPLEQISQWFSLITQHTDILFSAEHLLLYQIYRDRQQKHWQTTQASCLHTGQPFICSLSAQPVNSQTQPGSVLAFYQMLPKIPL